MQDPGVHSEPKGKTGYRYWYLKTKESVMCRDHNKVCGREAVEELASARISNNVCSTRMEYLARQAKSFHAWLQEQEWCEDATVYCSSIVHMVEKELDPDADTCAEYVLEDNALPLSQQLEMEFDEYNSELEAVADRATRKANSKMRLVNVLENMLERMHEELELHDRIQDGLDGMKRTQYHLYSNRLDELYKEKKLSYSGWVIFKNQLRTLMGWKLMRAKYPVVCIADSIRSAEVRLEKLNKQIQERPEFFSDPHPAADKFLENYGAGSKYVEEEQQVYTAGLAEMQQSYLCPMCGAESFPGYKGCSCS
jgi:hypothetical protein